MYEEWFEKIAKSLNIENVIDTEKNVTLILPVEISNMIQGDKLFVESYNINHNFRLEYKNRQIHIILDKFKLKKHYLMYLIALLIKLREMIKEHV